MLTATFQHLPGIGPSLEKRLRESGVTCWSEACVALESEGIRLPLPDKLLGIFRQGLEESLRRLEAADALWFSRKLRSAESWRLFPHFRDSCAYVDIETTGLGRGGDHITSLAMYDGSAVRTYVHGVNMEDFAAAIGRYTLLVTWNGRAFDVPFIQRELKLPLNMAHLDLLPVMRALDYRGGLKAVEKRLGLDRSSLGGVDGVDGRTAIFLWREHKRGNPTALESLLAYNVEDVLSLERIAFFACAAHGVSLPEPGSRPVNPYTADPSLLRRLTGRSRL